MSEQKGKKRSWLKKLLWVGLVLVVVGAGIYWYVATEKFSDTKDREAAYTVSAIPFIREFVENSSMANAKYAEKIVVVNGRVSEIEPADTTMNIKFIDSTNNSFAIFAFQPQHLSEAKTVKVGDSVSIKASCSGGVYSELLGSTKIDFKRSTLNNK